MITIDFAHLSRVWRSGANGVKTPPKCADGASLLKGARVTGHVHNSVLACAQFVKSCLFQQCVSLPELSDNFENGVTATKMSTGKCPSNATFPKQKTKRRRPKGFVRMSRAKIFWQIASVYHVTPSYVKAVCQTMQKLTRYNYGICGIVFGQHRILVVRFMCEQRHCAVCYRYLAARNIDRSVAQ